MKPLPFKKGGIEDGSPSLSVKSLQDFFQKVLKQSARQRLAST